MKLTLLRECLFELTSFLFLLRECAKLILHLRLVPGRPSKPSAAEASALMALWTAYRRSRGCQPHLLSFPAAMPYVEHHVARRTRPRGPDELRTTKLVHLGPLFAGCWLSAGGYRLAEVRLSPFMKQGDIETNRSSSSSSSNVPTRSTFPGWALSARSLQLAKASHPW